MNRLLIAGAAVVAILAPSLIFAPPASAEEDPVVATVDGEEILRSRALQEKGRMPAQVQQAPDDLVLPMLVSLVVDTKLLAAEANRQNLREDAEIREQLARLEEILLAQVMLSRAVEDQITDEALEKKYQELVEKTADEEEMHARHILVKDEEEAKAIIAELNKGADFGELAKQKSIGPSAQKGGDLGYFAADAMVPAFSAAAAALEKGAITEEPVETQFGWHVIKLEDRRKAEPPSLDQVSEQLRSELVREARAAYIEDLRGKADIETFVEMPAEAPEGGQPAK